MNPMIGEATARHLEENHPATAGWALSCCRWDREEAEEVLQMTYLKVLNGHARFDDRSSFKTWLFGVVRRTAAERRRSRWMRAVAGLRWQDGRPSPPPVPTPETLLAACEISRSLRAALETLPARQREVLHLVFYQDLTIGDAAIVLGISLGSARTHYQRGKASLRDRLARKVNP